jgi:hypothetical protein
MPAILEKLGPLQKNRVITGDKCLIYWDDYHCEQ